MKFSNYRGFRRIYDPKDKEKQNIQKIIFSLYGSNLPMKHPRVSFIFHMPIPKSIPKKYLPIYQSGFLKHEKKPDADNFIKLYLDCMDGITFEGDQKVMLGSVVKLYHPEPKTIIILNESKEMLNRFELDFWASSYLFEQESCKHLPNEKDCLSCFYNQTHLEALQSHDMTGLSQTTGTSLKELLAQKNQLEANQVLGSTPYPCL